MVREILKERIAQKLAGPMPNADPNLMLNCPKCPRPLVYITKAGDVFIYECPEHGRWALTPQGRLEPQAKLVH